MNKLLLQACYLEPKAAFAAYQSWKSSIDFEQLNSHEFGLLPHMYQHLQSYLNDELTPRLVGIYKQARILQQQRIYHQQIWQQRLEQHGIAYQLLNNAQLGISATADFTLQNINLLLSVTPKDDWLMSKQKYWLHWNIRGWVAFKYSTRVFRQACPEPILHRLEYSHNDMVWLIRALPELEHISDWQPFFAAAQPFGLRKRLYNLLEFAQKAGLLKPMPLAIQFSSFDQMQFRLFQSKSWLSRASYAYFIQLQKNQRNP